MKKFSDLSEQINEGIDFDYNTMTVSYNAYHEDNVDTSVENNPTVYNDIVDNVKVYSIFKRKRGLKGDGNPLIYALKDEDGWKFRSKKDKDAIDKQFNDIAEKFSKMYQYGPVIVIPSTNELNTYISNIIVSKNHNAKLIKGVIRKLTTEEVKKIVLDKNSEFRKYYKDDFDEAYDLLDDYLDTMDKEKDGYFAGHYVKDKKMRNILKDTFKATDDNYARFAKELTDKDILLIDDTVSRGQSIKSACKIISDTYSPKSITVLTLLSKLD